MATLRVGQRVRVIGTYGQRTDLIGQTGTISRPYPAHPFFPQNRYEWAAILDCGLDHEFVGPSEHFAPLTDPKADAFIARMKREYLNDRVALLRIGNGALEHQLRALYPDELDGTRGGAA